MAENYDIQELFDGIDEKSPDEEEELDISELDAFEDDDIEISIDTSNLNSADASELQLKEMEALNSDLLGESLWLRRGEREERSSFIYIYIYIYIRGGEFSLYIFLNFLYICIFIYREARPSLLLLLSG